MIDESFLWQPQSSWILWVSRQEKTAFKRTEILGGPGVAEKSESIEQMEVGSYHIGTEKDEMTEAQKRDWLCSTSHRARTQPSFIPVPWCTSEWMSTDLPCVNWRQTGHITGPLCVLRLSPSAWMWSFVDIVWCFRTETASGSKTCCLWKYSFPSHFFLLFFFLRKSFLFCIRV